MMDAEQEERGTGNLAQGTFGRLQRNHQRRQRRQQWCILLAAVVVGGLVGTWAVYDAFKTSPSQYLQWEQTGLLLELKVASRMRPRPLALWVDGEHRTLSLAKSLMLPENPTEIMKVLPKLPTGDCPYRIFTSIGGKYSPVRWNELKLAVSRNAAGVGWNCVVLLLDGRQAVEVLDMDAGESPRALFDTNYYLHQRMQQAKEKSDGKRKEQSGGNARALSEPTIIAFSSQPAYMDIIALANQMVPEGEAVALVHGDIELVSEDFEPPLFGCLSCARVSLRDFLAHPTGPHGKKRFVFLSRHPHPMCPAESGGGGDPRLPNNLCNSKIVSADTFFYTAPLTIPLEELTHVPNRIGSETRLANILARNGYKVEDGCNQFRTYHAHCSGARHPLAVSEGSRINRWHEFSDPSRVHYTCADLPKCPRK